MSSFITLPFRSAYAKSLEHRDYLVPRFKKLADYQEFLDHYYDAFEQIVIKKDIL